MDTRIPLSVLQLQASEIVSMDPACAVPAADRASFRGRIKALQKAGAGFPDCIPCLENIAEQNGFSEHICILRFTEIILSRIICGSAEDAFHQLQNSISPIIFKGIAVCLRGLLKKPAIML